MPGMHRQSPGHRLLPFPCRYSYIYRYSRLSLLLNSCASTRMCTLVSQPRDDSQNFNVNLFDTDCSVACCATLLCEWDCRWWCPCGNVTPTGRSESFSSSVDAFSGSYRVSVRIRWRRPWVRRLRAELCRRGIGNLFFVCWAISFYTCIKS